MLQRTSYDSVTIISIDRAELLSRLREIARRIREEHPEVVDLRVFGSIARGDQVGTSDVDVLILLEGEDEMDPVERIRTFYPYFDLPIDVDLLIYTREELARRRARGDGSVERVWHESRAL